MELEKQINFKYTMSSLFICIDFFGTIYIFWEMQS